MAGGVSIGSRGSTRPSNVENDPGSGALARRGRPVRRHRRARSDSRQSCWQRPWTGPCRRSADEFPSGQVWANIPMNNIEQHFTVAPAWVLASYRGNVKPRGRAVGAGPGADWRNRERSPSTQFGEPGGFGAEPRSSIASAFCHRPLVLVHPRYVEVNGRFRR
jgi:hypothetical protein